MITTKPWGKYFTKVDTPLGRYWIEDVYEAQGAFIVTDETNEAVFVASTKSACLRAIREVTEEMVDALEDRI